MTNKRSDNRFRAAGKIEQYTANREHLALPWRVLKLVRRGAATSGFSGIKNSPTVSIMAYCLASICMTVINKYVVSGTHWNLTSFFLAIQNLVCIVTIMSGKKIGLIGGLAPFNLKKAQYWLPISLLLASAIYTTSKAIQFLSVPVYTVFKNLTIIVIAYGEALWFGGRVTPIILASFVLMILSSAVASWKDFQPFVIGISTPSLGESVSILNVGYAWMLASVICISAFSLRMRKFSKKMNFSDWDTMFYNNALTIPILLIGSFLLEDLSSKNLHRNFPEQSRRNLVIGIVYSGFGTIFISYSAAWCVRCTSPTTFAMVGALNKIPLAIFGFAFFHTPVTLCSILAIVICTSSGLVYAWGKLQLSQLDKVSLPTAN